MIAACCATVLQTGICQCDSEARWLRFQDRVNRLEFARHLYRTGRLNEGWPDGPPTARRPRLPVWCSLVFVAGAFLFMFALGGRS